jgi:hypothetical protein
MLHNIPICFEKEMQENYKGYRIAYLNSVILVEFFKTCFIILQFVLKKNVRKF